MARIIQGLSVLVIGLAIFAVTILVVFPPTMTLGLLTGAFFLSIPVAGVIVASR